MSERLAIPRPIPTPQPGSLNAQFYEHCASGALRFQRCSGCGTWRHLPRIMCARCGSDVWSWELSSARGAVYSWTVTHQALYPAFVDETPYIVVVVELAEGVRLVGRLYDLPPGDLVIGLMVQVRLAPVSEHVALPYFVPSKEGR